MEHVRNLIMQSVAFIRRYAVIICFVIFGAVYGYLAFTSTRQAAMTPSDAEINERLQSKKRTKIDDNAGKTLRDLSEQNIEIKKEFEEARNNPFSE